MTSLIIDIITALLIIFSFSMGRRKGLVKSVWKTASWIITAILVFVLIEPTVDFISGTQFSEMVNEKVYMQISTKNEKDKSDDAGEESIKAFPKFFTEDFDNLKTASENKAEELEKDLSENITNIIIKIAAFIILFVLIKIILAILFRILDLTSKLPVINGANKLLGGILGVINILFVIYIVCAVISLFAANDRVIDIINSSYLVKYFYNNNILMQLVLRM